MKDTLDQIIINNHRIYYLDEGEGEILVAIHGYPGRPHDFRFLLPHLNGVRLLAIAMPGLDITEPWPQDCSTVSSRAKVVCDFIEALNLHSFSLLGHSMGGVIATEVAVRLRSKVKRLILLSSVGTYPYRAFRRSRPHLFHQLLQIPIFGKLFVPFVSLGFRMLGFPRGVTLPAMLYVLACAHALDFKRHKDNIQQLKIDVLSIWSMDDPLIEEASFENLTALLEKPHSLSLPSGGHNPQKAHPAKVAGCIVNFIC